MVLSIGPSAKLLDLRDMDACSDATRGVEQVYNLAADMGGMGFIENNKALCMLSVLINTHLLVASRDNGISRYFFSSSACVYPDYLQNETDIPGHARRRLWLGEAVQRKNVPAFSRRFWHRDTDRALSQRVRTIRDLGWRPREGSSRNFAQGCNGCDQRPSRNRNLGRWRADT